MKKSSDMIAAEMESLVTRLDREFPGRVDRQAILILMDQAIEDRIEGQVSAIISSYASCELLQAFCEMERLVAVVSKPTGKRKGKGPH